MSQISNAEIIRAAKALHTELASLDDGIEGHVLRSQGAKGTSALLAIGAGVCLYAFPPAVLYLGLSSAGVGISASVGDYVHHSMTQKPFQDAVNRFDILAKAAMGEAALVKANQCHSKANHCHEAVERFENVLQVREIAEIAEVAEDVAVSFSSSTGGVASGTGGAGGAAAASGEVVRGTGRLSSTVCGPGGSGIAARGGGVAITRFAAGLTIVGAVISVYTAVHAINHPSGNAPLRDQVKDARLKAFMLVRALEKQSIDKR